MNQTIVSISGYGYSGSGAVKDLLSEFDEIAITHDFEFQILYFPDGISDLDYHLNVSCNRFYDSDVAINRFLKLCKKMDVDYWNVYCGHLYEMAYQYISKITSLQWSSYWAYDRLGIPVSHYKDIEIINNKIYKRNHIKYQFNRILRKLGLPQIKLMSYKEYFESRPMYLSIKPNNFLLETRLFVNQLLSYVKSNKELIIFDQFLPPNNPSAYYKYFDTKVKSIVVYRDPRDTWIFANQKKISFIPHDSLDDFIIWYRENNKKEAQVLSDDVLRIHFEDLVYDYDNTVNCIQNYLGIDKHLRPKKSFKPEESINNTQLVIKYSQYKDDILKIETQLSEFLYDFSKFDIIPKFQTNIF